MRGRWLIACVIGLLACGNATAKLTRTECYRACPSEERIDEVCGTKRWIGNGGMQP